MFLLWHLLGIHLQRAIRNVDKDFCTKMFTTASYVTERKEKGKGKQANKATSIG